ncbi:helix-turn-helix domain-containing protein [Flavobacterium sp.]|jgi:transcriptional regulator with XRE-family HTH domain|uniref:helix-turn-helix domain-containing protein n=1 Tax=Flavobacterium sp. TaxID=239 RepID=UPI0037BEB018
MLNTEDFIKRLEFIMDHFGLSASSFADKVSVQRSSISHLLSGRNKPSLDFVMKVLDIFPELNLYWLLDGSGYFLKNIEQEISSNLMENSATLLNENSFQEVSTSIPKESSFEKVVHLLPTPSESVSQRTEDKNISKIVLFYKDGTFESFNPSQTK